MNRLNIKQQRFADEYIKSGNATDAYIKAGYSKNKANTNATKLLQILQLRIISMDVLKKYKKKV